MNGALKTLRLRGEEPTDVARAAEILARGGLVAFPTETVYGLGANALDPQAVGRIFEAKQRPSWDPLIVHISDTAMLSRVVELTSGLASRAGLLMDRFWPGPLTLLLPRTSLLPEAVTAGRALVGVRMPAQPIALQLIGQAGMPIAAPSANRFGHTSPTTAAHVLDDLDGRIDAVLDGGATAIGVESTVAEVQADRTVIYRPGAVTPEQIAATVGRTDLLSAPAAPEGNAPAASLPSPGFGLRHYAPRARLILVEGAEQLYARCEEFAEEQGVGVLLPEGWERPPAQAIRDWAPWDDLPGLARQLFAGLRELDARGVAVILCPVPQGGGLAGAIRDRLEKAARPR